MVYSNMTSLLHIHSEKKPVPSALCIAETKSTPIPIVEHLLLLFSLSHCLEGSNVVGSHGR